MSLRRWVGIFLAGALVFRLAIVFTWHAPAGDGVQYYQLTQELRRAQRFAYSPKGPDAYSRLPGYPLFLSAVASPFRPVPMGEHVMWAVVWNVLLDLGSALLVLGILKERGLRGQKLGLALTALCPTLWLLSCFALAESLSTFLGTLTIYLAVRAHRTRPLENAVLAGAVAGFAQLVRADAITFSIGAFLILLWLRSRAVLFFTAAALIVFAPWPIRNQLKFGAPHFASTTMRMMDGTPLGDGPVKWARTWSSSIPGEGWYDLMLANGMPLDVRRPGVVLPVMYDDEAERARVVALFERYNREKLTPAVNEAFEQLAQERRARAPFRYWVTLPLGRIARLWAPAPDFELPFRVKWLGMPTMRPVLGWLDKLLFAAALVGAIFLWRRGERLLVAGIVTCVLARTVLYGFAIPHGTGGRYLIEVFPLLIVLATQAWPPRARATS
jgi:hypothetical protein